VLQYTLDTELRKLVERVSDLGQWFESDERDLMDIVIELEAIARQTDELRSAADAVNMALAPLCRPAAEVTG
jgi:hypothetical protein